MMTKVIALALVLGCLLSWQRRHDHSPRHRGEWAGKG